MQESRLMSRSLIISQYKLIKFIEDTILSSGIVFLFSLKFLNVAAKQYISLNSMLRGILLYLNDALSSQLLYITLVVLHFFFLSKTCILYECASK